MELEQSSGKVFTQLKMLGKQRTGNIPYNTICIIYYGDQYPNLDTGHIHSTLRSTDVCHVVEEKGMFEEKCNVCQG